MTLEQLVAEHDAHLYGQDQNSLHPDSHHTLRQLAALTVVNGHPSREAFWTYLNSLDLTNKDRLRPQWDSYFMVRKIYPLYNLHWLILYHMFAGTHESILDTGVSGFSAIKLYEEKSWGDPRKAQSYSCYGVSHTFDLLPGSCSISG
jgi:hypothetical protein